MHNENPFQIRWKPDKRRDMVQIEKNTQVLIDNQSDNGVHDFDQFVATVIFVNKQLLLE